MIAQTESVASSSVSIEVQHLTPDLLQLTAKQGDEVITIYGKFTGQGSNALVKVDVFPKTVMEGTETWEAAHLRLKNTMDPTVTRAMTVFKEQAKLRGYKTVSFEGVRVTGVRAGQLQMSKQYPTGN